MSRDRLCGEEKASYHRRTFIKTCLMVPTFCYHTVIGSLSCRDIRYRMYVIIIYCSTVLVENSHFSLICRVQKLTMY